VRPRPRPTVRGGRGDEGGERRAARGGAASRLGVDATVILTPPPPYMYCGEWPVKYTGWCQNDFSKRPGLRRAAVSSRTRSQRRPRSCNCPGRKPLVELYGGCMVVLKVSRCGISPGRKPPNRAVKRPARSQKTDLHRETLRALKRPGGPGQSTSAGRPRPRPARCAGRSGGGASPQHQSPG
jgi:hypothetical protein